MSQLIRLLENAIAGAVAQQLPDDEVRKIVLATVEDPEEELNTPEAAHLLNKAVPTLKLWRREGKGPTYRKDESGRVTYKRKWLNEHQNKGVVCHGNP